MSDAAFVERITRLLAFMLRHQPEDFDLEVDPFGWADCDEVVRALNERLGGGVEVEDLEEAVSAGDRQRYEIDDDRIRALYGHSIAIEPGEPTKPPERLYVGLPAKDAERALHFGLRGGRRRFLHLGTSERDARETGKRAGREYTVIEVRALDAWEEGVNFYDRKSLFLAEEVPANLLEEGASYSDGTPREEREARRSGGRRPERGEDSERGRDRGRRGRGRPREGDSEGRGRGRGGESEGRGRGPRRGDSPRGDSRRSEPVRGDSRRSEPGRGDSRRSEPVRGESGGGEPRRDDSRRDEARRPEGRPTAGSRGERGGRGERGEGRRGAGRGGEGQRGEGRERRSGGSERPRSSERAPARSEQPPAHKPERQPERRPEPDTAFGLGIFEEQVEVQPERKPEPPPAPKPEPQAEPESEPEAAAPEDPSSGFGAGL